MLKQVEAGVLNVAYEETGPSTGAPVLLLHGFPYDVHAYDEVTATLASADCHVLIPYLRGYGPTQFLSADTLRSGQQAVLAYDLLAFMDALSIEEAVLAGYDWGGRAACIVAALWPARVRGLVSGCGYNIQDIPRSLKPTAPEDEHRLWYQYYFHGERGRAGWHSIATTSASCCGDSGRRVGALTLPLMNTPPPLSTTRTSWPW
jgi:pimeloyl-ACP methyl ester carboxylesterase